jgi:putative transcriptional regulator
MAIEKPTTIKQPEIGKLIRKLRLACGLTQEQLAASLGVVYPTVNRWENGHAQPSPLAMQKIEQLKRKKFLICNLALSSRHITYHPYSFKNLRQGAIRDCPFRPVIGSREKVASSRESESREVAYQPDLSERVYYSESCTTITKSITNSESCRTLTVA